MTEMDLSGIDTGDEFTSHREGRPPQTRVVTNVEHFEDGVTEITLGPSGRD